MVSKNFISKKLRNILLTTALATTLSACGGGGGGGGAVGSVSNFVNNDLSTLSGSQSIISSYSNLLTSFNSTVSSGDFSSISAVLTSPDAEDRAQANQLLTMLTQAETLWSETEDLINSQSDANKYTIYNSESYKEAYAAMLYLRNYVKPVIQKVSNGQAVTLAEYNTVAQEDRAQELMTQEKTTTAASYAETKKIKRTDTITDDSNTSVIIVGEAEATTSATDWATVHLGGGQETRTVTTTVPNYRTTTTTRCSFTRTTLLNGTTQDGPSTCSVINTVTVEIDPTITSATETREGSNPVVNTVALDPVVSTVTEESDPITTTTWIDAESTTTETTEGSATTTTADRDVVTDVNNGDNTTTRTTVRYVDTTVTTPITTSIYRTRTYTDTVTKNRRSVTTTTPRDQLTYQDGNTETVNGTAVVAATDWTLIQVSQSTRAENILVSENTVNQVVTTADAGTQIAQVVISNAYTDNDTTLGTKTAGLSTDPTDHQTTEYNSNYALNWIGAKDAYARGWTGKGAVLGVIDTWQQTDHPDLAGKYEWYNDYTRYDTTVSDGGNTQYHGTHVAGIIAASKNDVGTHGVAYDAKLVGANVDYYGRGGISKGEAQKALADFAKLKSSVDDGGLDLNIVAVNMSFNSPQLFTDSSGSTVTQLSDGTYNAQEITDKIIGNGVGDARYWKIATDNDIILVNSAGNAGYNHAGDPGIWATETDGSGNLVLGGKMVIVGNWDGSSVSGNKAGHVCLNINTVNNTCNDTYKISDFYLLAPGNNIKSTVPTTLPGSGYMNSSGTSQAAPHVTGAFGVLNQMWPYMKGDNLVRLVLNTANKDLPGYDVNVHGQGLLDLNEATKPQGAVGITTTGRVDGPTVGLNSTYFATGTAMPSSLSGLEVMVVDEYDKNYYINLGNSIVVKDKRKVADVDAQMNGQAYLPVQQMYGSFAQGGQYDLGYMNFGLYTGTGGSGDTAVNVGKDFKVSKKLTLKTTLGTMNETNAWLGNQSDGVLGVGQDNKTNFGQIGAEYDLGHGIVSLDYSRGKTAVNTKQDSLIKSINDVETESFKIGYNKNDGNKNWGVTASIPSHITKGTMNLSVPRAVTLNGDVINEDVRSDISTKTFERNVGFYYSQDPVNEMDAGIKFKAEYRQNIAGQDGKNGVNLGLSYVKKLNTNCKFLWMKNPKCFEKDADGKEVLKADLYAPVNSQPETATAYNTKGKEWKK